MSGRINCIALDASVISDNAFTWYVNNYHRTCDILVLLHIHEVPIMSLIGGDLSITENYRETVQASVMKSKNVLEKFRMSCKEAGIEHQVVIENNIKSCGEMICEMAHTHNASVIIMGQRGLGLLSRTFLGSSSDYVLHHSHVPVIVVPPLGV